MYRKSEIAGIDDGLTTITTTTTTMTTTTTSAETKAQFRRGRIADLATELTDLYRQSKIWEAKNALFRFSEEDWSLKLEDISGGKTLDSMDGERYM